MQSHGGQHSEINEPVLSITGNGGHSKRIFSRRLRRCTQMIPGPLKRGLRFETLRLGPSASICVICG